MKQTVIKLALGCFFVLCGGRASAANQQDTNLPPDIARTLYESKLEHDEAMHKRFDPIIQDLSRIGDSNYAQLYSDAVHGVFFKDDADNGREWSVWQRENKGILEDPRLPLATEASSLYLRGQLYLVLGQQSDATACFIKVINIVANGPRNLMGFQLMQESLKDTLLFKYYNIAPEYVDGLSTYSGPICETEKLFKNLVLPAAIESDPRNIEAYWDTAIAAIANASSLSDAQWQKYAVDDYPRLELEEAKCLEQLGQKKNAIYLLEELLSRYPDSPRYKEMSDALIDASNSGNALSSHAP